MNLPSIFANLAANERAYFLEIARKHEKELSLHGGAGKLWEKDDSGKDWSNVTEHCLLEAARVEIFSKLLCFSGSLREQIISAAILHDFNKRQEVELTRRDISIGGDGRQGVFEAEEIGKKILRESGFPESIILINTNLTGDLKDIVEIKKILDLPQIKEEDIARLVMHYVDNYTRGSQWVEPAENIVSTQKKFNDIDRRSEMNARNPAYEKMNMEGKKLNEGDPLFNGMTRFEAAATINHLVEKKLVELLEKCGTRIPNPLDIPELIDLKIKEEIKKRFS